jgi:putative ATPase
MSPGLFDSPDRPRPSGDGDESSAPLAGTPLADRMRPRDLDGFVGQQHVVGPGTPLRIAIERDDLRSILLWGPPGSGKTTLARIIARRTQAEFIPFSAVLSGIKEVREVMGRARAARAASGRRAIVFVDEIHRFNKAQQDAFLPFVEEGSIVLIGATTENPSFEVNAALLSRSQVHRLERLGEDDLVTLLVRARDDAERGLGALALDCPETVLRALARVCQGDARAALGALELAAGTAPEQPDGRRCIDLDVIDAVLRDPALYHDKRGEEHFNLISALHKSMRDSDPDAALYWLARMLEAGDDPMYLARRIVRFASEDIGLADPRALTLALAAKEAVHFVGRPEADLALAQAAVFCAVAPKSNALYRAWKDVQRTIRDGATDPVPMAIRNAVTGLMKREGYGDGYRYAHDHEDAVTDLECLPDRLQGTRFYHPTDRGLERSIAEAMERRREARRRLLEDRDGRSEADTPDERGDGP